MMRTVNRVIMAGYAGDKPKIIEIKNGKKFARLRLATWEAWREHKSGEWRPRIDWHMVVVFNRNMIQIMEKYINKGELLYIEGELRTRKWLDGNGVEHSVTEVVVQGAGGNIGILNWKEYGSTSGGMGSDN